MSNKQQTAVEWFYDEMIKFIKLRSKYSTDREIFKQAKEMEKERMIDFAIAYSAQDQHKISAEDYYKENYGGNK
jgi:hypothetical protein